MRLSSNDIGTLMWLGSAACLAVGFFGFAIVAPWTFSVMSVEEAAVRCPGSIDLSWPSVVCSHGHPYKWELGLIRDNPLRYGGALIQMIVGLIGFGYGMQRTKRFLRAH